MIAPLAVLVFAVAVAMPRSAYGQNAPEGRRVVVEGTIVMSIEDDFQSGRATRHYFLDTGSVPSGLYELKLTQRQANSIQPGMRVRVSGELARGVLTTDQADEGVVALEPPATVAPGKLR